MTDDTMAPRGLLEKSSDADLLREMIGFAADGVGGSQPDRRRSWPAQREPDQPA
jgi:hypothetical protein